MQNIQLYTVADVRIWLIHNRPENGLSEQIIAPSRAWAIVHNPYVKDDDAIVAAVFDDGVLAAYTASFPDMLDGQRIWWCSTLYCEMQYTGRGYGLVVLGSLKEAHNPELTYDRWGAQETVEICSFLGMQTIYTDRYHLGQKAFNKTFLLGRLLYSFQSIMKLFHSTAKLSKKAYFLRYANYVDGETYGFMQAHRGCDLWLREQSMLNWIVRYPFLQGCPLIEHVKKDTIFTSNVPLSDYKVVKVYVSNVLIGVYILRCGEDVLSVLYLYVEEQHRDIVFESIVDHLIRLKSKTFITENKVLYDYVCNRVYFPKKHIERVSFSTPMNKVLPVEFTLQLGDGDSFA